MVSQRRIQPNVLRLAKYPWGYSKVNQELSYLFEWNYTAEMALKREGFSFTDPAPCKLEQTV